MERRLYRSRTDVVWAGVAGGVAEWLGWDPSLVRVAWVILTPLTGGLALLVYVVMWIVVPEAPAAPTTAASATPGQPPSQGEPSTTDVAAPAVAAPTPERRSPAVDPSVVLGAILIVAGAFLLLRNVVAIDWDRLWPVALVAVGAVLLIASLRRAS